MTRRRNVTEKLFDAHLVSGRPVAGHEIAITIDQTLTQDATGTLVMLTLESMGLVRVHTELSAQYVDHNLLQTDHKNPDDHLFLASACARFGLLLSPPGGGVSHPLHMERLGKPSKTLLGADSHTCAAGALGMLAIGAGGLDVALAMAGEPYFLRMPKVWGVRLSGSLPDWVSAKDVVLELLRRHGVAGGRGRILEYFGSGVAGLSAMDRHVIANMGAELGATATVFPSDAETRRFLAWQGREADFVELCADEGAEYELRETIELDALEPLVAKPSSPGNVVPVREVAGTPICQAYVGSSANPGYRDFAVVAHIVRGKTVDPRVSFDVNPTTRQVLHLLAREGLLADLVAAGARIHQTGCNGCIGMGQAPATGRNSLRTVPRNFPGRSGTREDSVWLSSPETAAASALAGAILDPRELGRPWFKVETPRPPLFTFEFIPPAPEAEARRVALVRGPNIGKLPELDALPRELSARIMLTLDDDVSTDEILPAGARVLPYRSNLEKIAEFCFERPSARLERPYFEVARAWLQEGVAHAILAGKNYGQGSSREHDALAPRSLGLLLVVAESFSRIHRTNLINYGVVPLTLRDPSTRLALARLDTLSFDTSTLATDGVVSVAVGGKPAFEALCDLSHRELELLRAGGASAWVRSRHARVAG